MAYQSQQQQIENMYLANRVREILQHQLNEGAYGGALGYLNNDDIYGHQLDLQAYSRMPIDSYLPVISQYRNRVANQNDFGMGGAYMAHPLSAEGRHLRSERAVATKRRLGELSEESIKGWNTRRSRGGSAPVGGVGTKRGARHNVWLDFLSEFRAQNPHLEQRELLKEASRVYHAEGMGAMVGGEGTVAGAKKNKYIRCLKRRHKKSVCQSEAKKRKERELAKYRVRRATGRKTTKRKSTRRKTTPAVKKSRKRRNRVSRPYETNEQRWQRLKGAKRARDIKAEVKKRKARKAEKARKEKKARKSRTKRGGYFMA